MTETPDRPGENGRHEDEPTLQHGPFPGAASSPGVAGDAEGPADASRSEAEDPRVDDPRRDPDTVSIPRPAGPEGARGAGQGTAGSAAAGLGGSAASGGSGAYGPAGGAPAGGPGGGGGYRAAAADGPGGSGAYPAADGPGGIGAYPAADGPGGTGGYRPAGYGPPGTPDHGPAGAPGYTAAPGYGPGAQVPSYGPAGYGAQGPGGQGYGQPPPGYGPAYAQQGSPGYGPQAYGPGYGPPGFHTAPRPGIIPLRPLGFGDFFGGAVAYIRANPVSTLVPALVVAVVLQLVQFGGQAVLGVTGNPPTSSRAALGYVARSLGASGIIVILGLVLGAVLTAMLFAVLRGALIGRRTDLGSAWRAALPKVLGLIGVTVLIGVLLTVIAVVGLGLAIGIGVGIGRVPGALVGIVIGLAVIVLLIYLSVLLSFATPAYVMEDIGVLAALSRSRDLVRGAWLQVFGVLLVATLAVTVIAGLLTVIAGAAGSATSFTAGGVPGPGFSIALGLVSVVITTFATPFLAGVTGLLYVDQRIRRERFDLQLATWAAQAQPTPPR